MSKINSSEMIHINYKKMDEREHIRNRLGMYLGPAEVQKYKNWTFINDKFIYEDLEFSYALYKSIDEVICNSIDHVERTRKLRGSNKCNKIMVSFNKEGEIIIENNGQGILIEKFNKLGDDETYIPEVIFSQTRTSSNYDDNDDQISSGINGLGVKLTNFTSEYFIIETSDTKTKKYYCQKFEDGNKIKNKPIITNFNKIKEKELKNSFVKITFKPDYMLFYKKEFNQEIYEVLNKIILSRLIFTSVYCNNITTIYNDNEIAIKTLEDLSNKIFQNNQIIKTSLKCNKDIMSEVIIIVKNNEDNYPNINNISLINGIVVKRGSHIQYINKLILDNLTNNLKKLSKNNTIKSNMVTDNLFFMFSGKILKPNWKGQCKDELCIPLSKFKNYELEKKIYPIIWKNIQEELKALVSIKENKKIEKNNGSKVRNILNIENLFDAKYAGTNKSLKCKLFLTEGLSALSYAKTGISILGAEYLGAFPLKGKLLNVKDCSLSTIEKNQEINSLKKIIGLKHGHKYTSLNELRYGSIIGLVDSDLDGNHILGLIINLIHTFWPELIDLGFITKIQTPIIKISKGKKELLFYTLYEYQQWVENNSISGYNIKYFKGLGTSSVHEQRNTFQNKKIDQLLINYISDESMNTNINLGFNKKLSDTRKQWLLNYSDDNNILKSKSNEISCSDMINKELIHFSIYNVQRSIPSIMDGLKPSQRKILFTGFNYLKPLKEIKVAQFSAIVSQKSMYHHGEMSLTQAIINMAQNYVGSNNINYLIPSGQFGTRLQNGHDAASARYIFTYINEIIYNIFPKDDRNILNYLNEEGESIEPEFYIPCIPTVLINGCKGIGTGFSTELFPRDVNEICNYMLNKLDDNLKGKNNNNKLQPYFNLYSGTIIQDPEIQNKYHVYGIFKFDKKNNSMIITEIPIYVSSSKYKDFIEQLANNESNIIECDTSEISNFKIKIILKFKSDYFKTLLKTDIEEVYKLFKLKTTLTENNIYLFNHNNKINKYSDVFEIIDEFYNARLPYYQKRKDYLINRHKYELMILENKVNFINGIINENIIVYKQKIKDIENQLIIQNFNKVDNSYHYLTSLSINSLSIEKVKELEKKYKDKSKLLNQIKNTNIKEMWKSDIEEVLEIYNTKTKNEIIDNNT
jgi:DNA topoisomerase-2